jgi:RNA polymerase sigma-70 factor (ECF subfamily)
MSSNNDAAASLDAEQFRVLLDRHGDKVYNFAWRIAGNEADAQDLVQEAFARAFTHRNRFDPAKPFDAWVCRILHNCFLDNVRRYEHRRTVSYDAPTEETSFIDALPGRDPNPLTHLMDNEQKDFVQKALDALPPIYRTVVVLCDLEKYTYETAAEILDCPVGTVRSRLHEGRRLLKKTFFSFTVEPPL